MSMRLFFLLLFDVCFNDSSTLISLSNFHGLLILMTLSTVVKYNELLYFTSGCMKHSILAYG